MRRRLSLCAIVAIAAAAPGSAWAYFAASGTAVGTARVGAVSGPANITTKQSGSTVTLSWSAAKLSSGGAVDGYRVTRADNTVVCGKTAPVTTLTCTDTAVPVGTYSYTVTAVYHSFTSSATTDPIAVLTAPAFGTTPSDPSAATSPSFTFSGGGGTGYACKLDAGSFVACASPLAETALAGGSHTLTIHAVNGSSSGPDSSYTWTIDTTTPSITAKPANPSNVSSPTFSFTHAQSAYTFVCGVDGGGFSACASPTTYTGLSAASHTFQVRAVAADGSQTAATSYTWSIDTTAPTDSLSMATGASRAYLNATGSRLYYKGDSAGSLKLIDTVTDSGSGAHSATFPAIGTSGWTHGGETVTNGSGAPPAVAYTSSTYTWNANAGTPAGYSVSSSDAAGNASSGTAVDFVSDTGAPTGGALTVNGTQASGSDPQSYSSSTSFSINGRTDYAEAQSATQSGLASSTLTVQSAALSNGACGSAGSGGPFPSETLIAGTSQPSGILTGFCYVYRLTGADDVGNATSVATTVAVDTATPSTPALSFSGLSANAFYSAANNTLYFRPASGGAFTVTAASSAPSGIAGYNFSSLTANGFSGTLTNGQEAYTFGASATHPATAPTVSATSNTGRTSATAGYDLVTDTTAPSGGALTVNGTQATTAGATSPSATSAFAIGSRTDFAEAQSAAQSGLASATLSVQSETLAGGTCGAAGSGGPFASPATVTGTTQPTGILAGYCYQYTLTGADQVGNSAALKVTVPVPAPVAVTSVLAANGGTSHKLGAGDTVTITFSGPLNESTLCSTWSGTGNQTLNTNGQVVVTVTNGGASDDTLTVSTTSGCTLHFGSIDLGSSGFLAAGSQTYSGNGSGKSTIAYTGSSNTLTITLGSGTDSSTVSSSTLTYTPDANIKDTVGNAVTAGSSSGQAF